MKLETFQKLKKLTNIVLSALNASDYKLTDTLLKIIIDTAKEADDNVIINMSNKTSIVSRMKELDLKGEHGNNRIFLSKDKKRIVIELNNTSGKCPINKDSIVANYSLLLPSDSAIYSFINHKLDLKGKKINRIKTFNDLESYEKELSNTTKVSSKNNYRFTESILSFLTVTTWGELVNCTDVKIGSTDIRVNKSGAEEYTVIPSVGLDTDKAYICIKSSETTIEGKSEEQLKCLYYTPEITYGLSEAQASVEQYVLGVLIDR